MKDADNGVFFYIKRDSGEVTAPGWLVFRFICRGGALIPSGTRPGWKDAKVKGAAPIIIRPR